MTLHIVIVRVIDVAKLTREASVLILAQMQVRNLFQSAAERFGAAKRAIGAGRVSLAPFWVPHSAKSTPLQYDHCPIPFNIMHIPCTTRKKSIPKYAI